MGRSSVVSAREQTTSTRYRLSFRIGSGGAGTVYVGERIGAEGFSRTVAIKRAHAELVGDPEARRMLLREAAVASRLHNAHVVAVHDIEIAGDDVLLVLDWIPGHDLADLLEAGGRLPPRIAGRIALDVSEGLRAVHELCDDAGLPLSAVHGDVSPENVLVGFDGVARLTDFGLARLAHSSYATATAALAVTGKLGYLAPEVLDGGRLAARSDLFALGVVVWEAFACERLFGGAERDVASRVRTMPAPPISGAAPGVPAELDPILGRALEKSSKARHDSIAAFAAELEAVLRAHDLVATDSELGAHVRSVFGDSRRDALARARVTAAAGRPAIDFSFGDTASMVQGIEPLDDAPTPLGQAHLRAPAPQAEPEREPRSDAAFEPEVPTQSISARPRPRAWRAAALAAASIVIAGAVALAWLGRAPPLVAPAAAEPSALPSSEPAIAPVATVAAAQPEPTPRAASDVAPSSEATATAAVSTARPAPPRASAKPAAASKDPSSDLPANPYRKTP